MNRTFDDGEVSFGATIVFEHAYIYTSTGGWMPRWVVKAKGKSFYVDHIDATVPWSTRELDSGSTRGMLRFRKCTLAISEDRIATLRAA